MLRCPNKLAAFLSATVIIFAELPVSATPSSSCADVEVIFAHGSGAAANTNEDYLAFRSALEQELTKNSAAISTHFYDLGSSAHDGHQYPAVSIEDVGVITGTLISSGHAFAFGDSVKEGIAELKAYVTETSRACPGTKYVLAGYSQGAMVMSYAIRDLNPGDILYVANFGDPKLYLPEGKKATSGAKPLACAGKNLSNYRIDVPDCEVESGILGELNPYQLAAYTDKLGAWCNEADFMCGSYFDLSNATAGGTYEGNTNPLIGLLKAHLAYKSDGSYPEAAKIITSAIAAAYPDKLTSPSATANHHQNIAILLDVTGSMRNLIGQYRNEAIKITETAKAHGDTISLYAYGDELNENVHPTLLCDNSCSVEDVSQRLAAIHVDNGGDAPESALSALLHVMNTMTWQRGANKSIILLTDASYHNPDVNGITLNDVVRRSYEIDPVNIFTITPDSVASSYTELTTLTGGQTFNSATEIASSTSAILDRPYVNIGEVRYTDTPPATITDYSVSYSDAIAEITLTSDTSAAYYLTLDDAPLGLVSDPSFTLTDLPAETNLTVIPINPDGRPGAPLTLTLTPPSPYAPPTTSRNSSVSNASSASSTSATPNASSASDISSSTDASIPPRNNSTLPLKAPVAGTK